MLGLETALALALTELDLPIDARARAAVVAARRAIAGLGDDARRPVAAGHARQPLRDRPDRRRGSVDPARLASRSRNTPYAGRTLTRPGPPHDPVRANRSSSTARRQR